MKTKFDKSKANLRINIAFVVGLALIFFGVMILLWYFSKNSHSPIILRGIITFVIGSIVLYIEMATSKRTWFLYLSSLALIYSVVLIFMDTGFLPWKFSNVWPILMIIAGVILFPFCAYRNGRLKAVYVVPGVVIIIFGIVFMLFSLNIIQDKLNVVASKFWPLLLIVFGIVLIVIYCWQQFNIKRGTPEKAIDESADEDTSE
ncbi:MAG: LiaI-LiaF-like domain-containing protein [Treponemataceae bacterium]